MWSPPDPGIGVEGGSADVAGRWEGGGLESGWVLVGSGRAPKIMGARPHLVGGLVISSFSSSQLRVDDFKIRSR